VTGTPTPSSQTSILVRIPTPLRRLTGGQGEVTAEGRTVQELLDALERQFPGVKERLYDESGQLRRFVNIYVNDEDIRFAQGLETGLKKGDELSIVPAIAGGDGSTLTIGWPLDPQGGSGRGGSANPKTTMLGNFYNDAAPKAGGPHKPPHEMEFLWPA
jgi:molybdopterin synthase sulfur carrier subunit